MAASVPRAFQVAHNENLMWAARRLSVALALVVAVIVGPLVADYCADACEHSSDTSAGATVPACHRSESSGSRIGSLPAPCGHNHQTTLIAVSSAGSSTRALINSLAVLPDPIIANATMIQGRSSAAPELPPDRTSYAAPSPLRI